MVDQRSSGNFIVAIVIIFCFILFGSCGGGKKDRNNTNTKDSTTTSSDTAKSASLPAGYETYCNGRFDYCIGYPSSLLTAQPESENGDGRVFQDEHQQTILTVYGTNREGTDSDSVPINARFANDILDINRQRTGNDSITFKMLYPHSYLIYGIRGGKIFRQKVIEKKSSFAYAILEYDVQDSTIYNEAAINIFRSFK